MADFVVAALYRFVTLDNSAGLREPLLAVMQAQGVRGTLLLAPEGINGTVAGSREAIDSLLAWLRKDPRMTDLEHKESHTDKMPFARAKVKLKKEIVTMGITGIDPTTTAGTYVQPEDWNALITDPDVVLIDTRNEYEVNVGTFKGAINPHTTTFREFPHYVDSHLDPKQHRKVAMFCTGGIRCEKSTAFLKEQGFNEVYHLKGGILKYLETVPEAESRWQGECFVFDERVTVDHQLQKGHYEQCHACRMPLSGEDQNSEYYVSGVSCPWCHDLTTKKQQARFSEREKQVRLARQRGEPHRGDDVAGIIQQRKAEKRASKDRQRR
jgi:UPF0176 protein